MSKQKYSPAKIKTQLTQLATISIPTEVSTDADYEKGRFLYKELKTRLKEVEARQTAILDPLKKSMTEVKALFKPALLTLTEASTVLHKALNEFANRREEERQAALEKINNDARLKRPETIQRYRAEVATKADGTMRVQELVILDPDAIPDQFWILDEVALRKALMAGQVIPGATLKETVTVTSR